ncbi:MAG: tetratricopeptide repeat protein, partial [Alphaproteobacteria bacterium]|nr:tetratricopeptide repeat protein [Alphaproteobacteria bacterium]
AGGVATQGMLSFSRDEERMADNMGLDLMRRAGYDPAAFVQVFEQMRDITGAAETKINPNRINHPLTAERLKNVREYIATHPGKYKSANETYADKYELVRAKLVGYLETPARIADMYPASNKSTAAVYARAISDMRGGKYDAAASGVKTLIGRSPRNPYFNELLGDIEFAAGHYDAAVAAYEQALKYAAQSPQIQTALALVLAERGAADDTARARELCLRANLTEASPLSYWALARTYGSDPRANWAMAEYYSLMGNTKKARSYAKQAQKSLPHDSPEFIKSGDILNKK